MKTTIDGELLSFAKSLSVNLDKVEIVSGESFRVVLLSKRNEGGSVGEQNLSVEVSLLDIVAVFLGELGVEFTVLLLSIIDLKYNLPSDHVPKYACTLLYLII